MLDIACFQVLNREAPPMDDRAHVVLLPSASVLLSLASIECIALRF